MRVIVTQVGNGFLIEPARSRKNVPDRACVAVEGQDPKKLGEAILKVASGKDTDA